MKITRRLFIKVIPAVAVLGAGGALWFLVQNAREPIITPQVAGTTSAVSRAAPTTEATSVGFEFPITWNADQPTAVNSSDYRLKIDGDVSNPLELKLEELYAMGGVKKTLRIACAEGWEADVPWEGVPLSYLLMQAGSSPESVAHVTISAITGYSTTLSSVEAANLDTMIALKAGGAPLSIDHGYPARLVAPSREGGDWVKCVSRITCTSS